MKLESKIIYSKSESEPDFSFAINFVSDFDSASESNCESDSEFESDSSLALINLGICIFFTLYSHSSK